MLISNTVLQAQQEVENALIGFLKAQQRAQKLVGATAAAQRSVDLATLQYRQGITDFTTVLTAEQNLLTYQDSLASTLGDISSNLVGMYRAMGGGWQMRAGPGFRARRRERGHGQTQQLGQAADAGGPAAAGGTTQIRYPAAAMVTCGRTPGNVESRRQITVAPQPPQR